MDIGKRIKARRKELGLSAEELAKLIGVSPATVYRYESADIMNMKTDKLKPIAEALNTTPVFLMGWGEQKDEFTELFRKAISEVINNADITDMQSAGLEIAELCEIAHGDINLTLEKAFKIADALGISLDELLGRETIRAPAIEEDNERTLEFIKLFKMLTPEKQSLVIALIKGFLSTQ